MRLWGEVREKVDFTAEVQPRSPPLPGSSTAQKDKKQGKGKGTKGKKGSKGGKKGNGHITPGFRPSLLRNDNPEASMSVPRPLFPSYEEIDGEVVNVGFKYVFDRWD